jgi:hypothetical protein
MGRRICEADLQLFVHPDGDDGNSGLSPTLALQTIQRAVDCIYQAYDLCGHAAVVNVADGLYQENVRVHGAPVGGNVPVPLTIKGCGPGPGNVILKPAAGDAIFNQGATIQIQDMRLEAPAGRCMTLIWGGVTNYKNIQFGPASVEHLLASGHIARAIGDCEIVGSAPVHAHITAGAVWGVAGTITLTGNPSFAWEFAGVNFARVAASGARFVGAASGVRHLVHYNSYVETGGALQSDFFPGDQPGVIDQSSNWS